MILEISGKKAAISVLLGALLVSGGVGIGACSYSVPTGQQAENNQQDQSTQDLVNNQPLPHFTYSQMRQNLTEIETAQATGVQTTSFFFNQGVADPMDSCPSIGVPIAASASLSNPHRVDKHSATDGGNAVIDQMDPNGVYTPPSTTGTYVVCVDATGTAYTNYWEGFVQTVFAPARWNTTTHKIELIGPPSFKFSKSKG